MSAINFAQIHIFVFEVDAVLFTKIDYIKHRPTDTTEYIISRRLTAGG